MTEFLNGARRQIEERLTELRDEVRRLEAAAAALGDGAARRRHQRPGGHSQRQPGRERPRESGRRAVQAEKLVREHPGITISGLAKRMKIQPTYLYRVMPRLQEQGKVRKRGTERHPV
jgi:hypothetical protein